MYASPNSSSDAGSQPDELQHGMTLANRNERTDSIKLALVSSLDSLLAPVGRGEQDLLHPHALDFRGPEMLSGRGVGMDQRKRHG